MFVENGVKFFTYFNRNCTLTENKKNILVNFI